MPAGPYRQEWLGLEPLYSGFSSQGDVLITSCTYNTEDRTQATVVSSAMPTQDADSTACTTTPAALGQGMHLLECCPSAVPSRAKQDRVMVLMPIPHPLGRAALGSCRRCA